MTRYRQLADDMSRQIRAGVLRPGDRLPTVRQVMHSRGLSRGTVITAYRLLENLGEVSARPRSGYYVRVPAKAWTEPAKSNPQRKSTAVEVSRPVFELLDSLKDNRLVHLAAPWIDNTWFPLADIDRYVARATRKLRPESIVASLPPGNPELKRLLARRYLESGCSVDSDEIVITSGAADALNLAVIAVARPGEIVAIESPAFYGQLQALELFGLKALEIPTDPREGIDIAALADATAKFPVKACWVMTNFQNPLGFVMSPDRKKELVRILARQRIPLIEDDVYEDLYFGDHKPAPAKAYDRDGSVLHCSSFSKTMSPGYRVGWISAGRYAARVQRHKWMTTVSTNMQGQAGLAEYLKYGGHDSYLRGLRRTLLQQRDDMARAIREHFPAATRMTSPGGGYFLWLQLPLRVKAAEVQRIAFANGITVAAGPLFSSQRGYENCIRLNYGQRWTERVIRAIAFLGRLVTSMV
jgi:DNA-binding transcriptional MocR family regulator